MRISTNQLYDQNIRSIMDSQQRLGETQQQLSTGKKINRAADDPVGATKVLRLNEELDQIKQYQRNNDLLVSSLTQQEAILDSINNTTNRARTLAVQAGSGALSEQDRSAIAEELKHIRDELFDLMNSKDANGNYIYSGHQAGVQPFTFDSSANGNNISFAGDGGKNFVQVSDGVRIQASSSGQEVFQNVLARHDFTVNDLPGGASVTQSKVTEQATFDSFYGSNYDNINAANNAYQFTIQAGNQIELTNSGTGDIVGSAYFTSGEPFSIHGMEFTITGAPGDTVDFSLNPPEKKNLAETINELYVTLSTGGLSTQEYEKARNDALVGIDKGLEKVALERSSIGGRLNTAQSIDETNLDLELVAKTARSTIQDVDAVEASIELVKQETALNAALATFPKVANLSLFNYI